MTPIEISALSIFVLVKTLKLFTLYTEELQAYKRETLYQVTLKVNVFIFFLWEGSEGTFEHLNKAMTSKPMVHTRRVISKVKLCELSKLTLKSELLKFGTNHIQL